MSFFPKDFSIKEKSSYLKFTDEGEYKFRVLGSFEEGTAISGYTYWKTVDGKPKPVRVPMDKTIPASEIELDPKTGKPSLPLQFISFPVWDYKDECVKILEIKQKTVMKALKDLSDNPKWGDLREYDLVVNKTGKGFETKFTTFPDPKEKLSPEIAKIYESMDINMYALFENKDPFAKVA